MTAETEDAMQVFDRAERDALRRDWLRLIDLSVWGELKAARLGALPRLRRRVAELGELLAAIDAPRDWIPQSRERLKSALATALAARDTLAQCAQALDEMEPGAARDALRVALERVEQCCAPRIAASTERWARRLDALNSARIED
jgi:hypothetical protein